MQLRLAEERDREGLSDLWVTCFPGDEAFRDYFLKEVFEPRNAFVYADGDRIVSMAHILPMEIDYHSNVVPAGYIFAVGTDPEYRGRGLAARVLEQIFAELRHRNIPLAILVPQKDSLFEYYKRFGFAEVFGLTTVKLRREGIPDDKISDRYTLVRSSLTAGRLDTVPTAGDISDANSMFENVMRYRNHLLRTDLHWERAVRIAEIAGGGMFLLKDGGTLMGYAVCEITDDGLLINELFAEDEESYHTLCAKVLDEFRTNRADMLTPACPHDAERFGMARILDAKTMLSYAASYRKDMNFEIVVSDRTCPWNSGKYRVEGPEVGFAGQIESRAHITPGQLSEVLFGAGPIPYVNLLFS